MHYLMFIIIIEMLHLQQTVFIFSCNIYAQSFRNEYIIQLESWC